MSCINLIYALMISWIDAVLFSVILQYRLMVLVNIVPSLNRLCKCILITLSFISLALFIVFFYQLKFLQWYICNWIQQPNKWYLLFFWAYQNISCQNDWLVLFMPQTSTQGRPLMYLHWQKADGDAIGLIKDLQMKIQIVPVWATLLASTQGSWGQHGAHLGPVGPRWAPCRPHEPCCLGISCVVEWHMMPLMP